MEKARPSPSVKSNPIEDNNPEQQKGSGFSGISSSDQGDGECRIVLPGEEKGHALVFSGENQAARTGTREVWEQYGDRQYNIFGKGTFLERLYQFSSEGRLGRRVMDVGCGPRSVINYLPPTRHEKIFVDIVSWFTTHKSTFITADVNDAADLEHIRQSVPPVDSMVFSSIVNYTDYERLFSGLDPVLAPGGRVVVFNKAEATFPQREDLLHPKRPRSAQEIADSLSSLGYGIETFDDLMLDQYYTKPQDWHTHLIVAQKQNCLPG